MKTKFEKFERKPCFIQFMLADFLVEYVNPWGFAQVNLLLKRKRDFFQIGLIIMCVWEIPLSNIFNGYQLNMYKPKLCEKIISMAANLALIRIWLSEKVLFWSNEIKSFLLGWRSMEAWKFHINYWRPLQIDQISQLSMWRTYIQQVFWLNKDMPQHIFPKGRLIPGSHFPISKLRFKRNLLHFFIGKSLSYDEYLKWVNLLQHIFEGKKQIFPNLNICLLYLVASGENSYSFRRVYVPGFIYILGTFFPPIEPDRIGKIRIESEKI